MNEMIERIAKELMDRAVTIGCEYALLSRIDCRKLARDALTAAREPTDAMLDAARWACVAEDVAGVWTTMIDAALEEK